MDLHLEKIRQPPLLRVAGEVDVFTSPQLQHAIAEVRPPDASAPLMLDMAGVSFIDSTGLSVLFRAAKHCAGGLVLLHPQPGVQRVLEQVMADHHPGLTVIRRVAAAA